jgi:hypothetical protein
MKLARLAALAALPLAAAAAAAPLDKPKLVVVISVDQFSADLFAQYRQQFDGGLERLSEGVVFPMGYQSHAATETCPGHSTILTGSRPARTGIIANNWFDLGAKRDDKNIYCAEDENVPGSNHRVPNYTASTLHLKVPALGDHMKRSDPRSRVVAVAGKDRSAMMMGGYGPDERWWWGSKNFINPKAPATPGPVAQTNDEIAAAIARGRGPRDLPDRCRPYDRAVPIGNSGPSVGTGRFAREAGKADPFKVSPELDQATIDLALRFRKEMKLGEGPATDLLILGLSATDYVGHTYGTQGTEMCIQLLALDEALGAFFRDLDSTGVDYLVMLTADHGGIDVPERQREHAVADAERVPADLYAGTPDEPGKLATAIATKLKIKGPILHSDGPSGDIYLDRSLSAVQRSAVVRELKAVYGRYPQYVAAVFTKTELAAAPAPQGPPDSWTLRDRAKASFDPVRSGDLVVLLKPRKSPIFDTGRGYVATHGSPWDYDRRVPILFWRKGLASYEQPMPVETADILPTLAAVIGVPVDLSRIDGRCLDLDEGPGDSCR